MDDKKAHLPMGGDCEAVRRLLLTCMLLMLAVILRSSPVLAAEEAADSTDVMEMGIEELMQLEVPTVYGASKYVQTVQEAPASVTIITADEIRKYGWRHLGEVLQAVRGFSVYYDRTYHYASVRGFNRLGDYNSRILQLIDGIRINESLYDSPGLGRDFPLDLDLVERIEIIRGPSQSLHGNNAFAAVINVITRHGSQIHGAEASAELGSEAARSGRLTYGRQFRDGTELVFSGTLFKSRGDDLYFPAMDTPEQNNGWAEGADGERLGSAFLRLSRGDFTLEGGLIRRRKTIPTASYETLFNTDGTWAADNRIFADLKFERSLGRHSDMVARLSYNRYRFEGDYLYDDGTLNQDRARADSIGAEVYVTRQLFRRHQVIVGAEFRDNFRQDQKNFDQTDVYMDNKNSSRSWALFAQDEYSLRANLVLHGGLRYDHFDSFGGTVNPRLALVYTPRGGTVLKLIYGRAFRAPNQFELNYYSVGEGAMVGNPDLGEETVDSYEAMLEQTLGEWGSATVSLYNNDMRGIITEVTEGEILTFENHGHFRARGMELELQGKWPNGLQGRASYSLQRVTDVDSGETVPNAPQHLLKLNLAMPLWRQGLFLGLEEQYTGRRKDRDGAYLPGFAVTNANLYSRNLRQGLELSLGVYNIFDKRYQDAVSDDHPMAAIEQDGRSWRLKITYSF